jgi:hypothetical protein
MNLYIVVPLLSLLFFAVITVIWTFRNSKYRDRVEDDSSTDCGTFQRQTSTRRLELETYGGEELHHQISTGRLELETYGGGEMEHQISTRRLELETYGGGEMEHQISTRRRLELETYGGDTIRIGS